jgi:hypothetical protein
MRQVSRCKVFSLLTKSNRRGVLAGFAFLRLWIPFSLVVSSSTYVARSQRSTIVGTSNCPVTRPNGGRPVGTAKADPMYFGNGKLWTTLWPDGKMLALVHKDGSLWMKLPWWKAVRAPLTITGRRLDGSSAPLKAEVPSGYKPIGFQPSQLIFPSEGCWEIVGRADDATLRFVTEIRADKR